MKACTSIDYDMYIHWELLRECTFSCEYCFAKPQSGPAKELNIEKINDRLDRFGKTILITFTGGEPFLIPNFTEFIEQLTKKHFVRVDTNLSLEKRCNLFIERIDPKRIYEISFSIHAGEREKHNLSLQNLSLLAKKFQDNGFKIVGNYVVYPPYLKRLQTDLQIFEDNGIEVLPSMFVGRYNGKEYPFYRDKTGYTEDELALILKYNEHARVVLEHKKGEYCPAGTKAFYIDSFDQVFPCTSISKKLGNFWGEWRMLPKVIRCPQCLCSAPFNRAFASSENTFTQELLLSKAIEEKGTASSFQTVQLVGNPYQMAKDIMLPILDRLSLKDQFYSLKTLLRGGNFSRRGPKTQRQKVTEVNKKIR